MAKFRHSLKAEIGVFFPMIMLKAIEAPQVPVGTPFGEPACLSTGNHVWWWLHMLWKLSHNNVLLLSSNDWSNCVHSFPDELVFLPCQENTWQTQTIFLPSGASVG